MSCCWKRLFPFEIRIIDANSNERKCQGKAFNVGDKEIPSPKTNPIRINCGNLIGTSLRLISFNKERILNLCEIKIMGK